MTTSISNQLREKLFDKPSLSRRQEDFDSLHSEMFPGRSHFMRFLEERHPEAQIEEAKHILLRLAYQSEFPPPNKFIYNLLETESHLAGATMHGAFIGRDHFVHLANLYLLGLYVFWYSGAMHNRLVGQFQGLAKSLDHRSHRESRMAACRSFIESWREFVIFHDLGYPWEVGAGLGSLHKYLEPFPKIEAYATKDGALFVISQLIAAQWVRREEEPTLLRNDLRMSSHRSNQERNQGELYSAPREEAIRNWGAAERLPTTTDSSLWRLISVTVPREDRLCLLETTADGQAVASSNDDVREFLSEPRPAISELGSGPEFSKWAARNALPPRLQPHYQWSYYVKDLDAHFDTLLRGLFPSHPNVFRRFADKFLDTTPP